MYIVYGKIRCVFSREIKVVLFYHDVGLHSTVKEDLFLLVLIKEIFLINVVKIDSCSFVIDKMICFDVFH